MENLLTKTDIKTLKDYSAHLQRAKDGYVRGIYDSDLNRLEPIYNKYGQHLENKHCASCVLGMLLFLSNQYDKINTVKE
jgi:hypothetical protein